MSGRPPPADCDKIKEGEKLGEAVCSPEASAQADNDEHGEDNLYPFDNLAVELYEDPDGAAEARGEVGNGENDETYNDESNNGSTSAEVCFNSDIYDASEAKDGSMEAEPAYGAFQKTYIEDFIYSNTSSFDEGSNSNIDDAKEEPKGIPLRHFPKIVKTVEIAEYETLQILYQLMFQRSAWDTQEILIQRILDFAGFNFKQNSEDFFNRDMMLQTQTNEILVKLGAMLSLDEVQLMFSDPVKGRVEIITSILQFLSKPCKKTRVYSKGGSLTVAECLTASNSKCGCRNRCFSRFTTEEKKRLLEYIRELEALKLMDSYLLTLMEFKKIARNHGAVEDYKKLKEVYYSYRCRFHKKELNVCKGAFCILHGIKMGRVNQLQNKLKTGKKMPVTDKDKFPPIISDDDPAFKQHTTSPVVVKTVATVTATPDKMSPSRRNLLQAKNGPKVWMSSEEQVRKLEEELNSDVSVEKAIPKVVVEKCDKKGARKETSQPEEEATVTVKNENVKLKDFALVVKAIKEASDELLIDVHFLLYLGAAEADKLRENILEFCGFPFTADSEEYDERNEFLQRMSFKIVTEVARSFSLAVLSTKEDTIKNILTFLLKPEESFLRATSTMPLSLSDVELDDLGDLSDSDVSITCEVVEKKVECIDLLSSGEDSDTEGKPRKEKKAATPQKTVVLPKPAVLTPQVVIAQTPVATTSPATESSESTGTRQLRNFETICKIVNTHPHEYLVDIYDLLYLQKYEPSTLRSDILDFTGFNFDKTSTEYVKRKQLLDRMLYNSVRRIYNTLIHNTTEVKVFSKPTMITEIFQFLFKLPDHDTSVRPPPTGKPVTKPPFPGSITCTTNTPGAVAPSIGMQTLPIQSGKLSDLKRVFQRVACFPCEYLIDVHKLLFMTDCDSKVIRNNIFAFKGFPFGVDSQDFQQRKMYLEYLTFHSLRKISSVLTTRSVDLRNSTKHELATHLTQVLAEYCNTNVETDIPSIPSITTNQTPGTPAPPKSTSVENIVITPILDPSHANPSEEPAKTSGSASNITQTATPPFAISIVDARSVSKPTPSTRGRKRKNTPSKAQDAIKQKNEPSTQFADINLPEVEQYRQLYGSNLNVYNPNAPALTGIATFNTTNMVPQIVPQTMPLVNVYPQSMQVQAGQLLGLTPTLGPTIVTQVPSKQGEIILPGESIINENEEPSSKKAKSNASAEEPNGNHNKPSVAEDDEDCDKPLSSLVGHPIDSVLKNHIKDIVEKSDLANITINGVIQKVFNIYPKFDLSYRKDFIKSTLRTILYRLGEEKNSEKKEEKRDTDSPDCSVTTTNKSDSDFNENSNKSSMECSS